MEIRSNKQIIRIGNPRGQNTIMGIIKVGEGFKQIFLCG
jgi:hypothetical protein